MKRRQGFRMHKLGMITIGQASRSDVAPIVERALEGRAELLQAGALDGLSLDYIQQHLAPSPGEYVLTSRLTTGESVVISREKILPLLQDKITRMEEQGIRTILLLCTGVFPGLNPKFAAASPYSGSAEEFRQAALQFKDQADLIVLDCMGYTDAHRELAARYAGVPVILSNALIGKLVSEMV
ncbi:AroM family protein [Paenibacillus brasilensis]|uniref:Protein AroM n=1 Tax=Paenibacillus brasilensis TaxID=128574 RepID=A0ABU0KY89_9BACL|nr:AroM family protein [Paenibacillus brasilensis]MDQ0494398.1 protein AroM [Paenibacillus brasilensis]